MKGRGFVIFLLFLASCSFGGYIVYDKFISNNSRKECVNKDSKKSDKNSNNSIKPVKLEEKDAATFIRKINVLNAYLYGQYPIDDVKNIPNQNVLMMGAVLVGEGVITQNGITGFSSDKLVEEIVSYFGSDYPYKLEDIQCHVGDGVLYQYNAQINQYNFFGNHGHDGISSRTNKTYFQEGTYDENSNTYVIRAKVLYGPICSGTCGPRIAFYGDTKSTEAIYTAEADTEFDVAYQAVSDKIPVTTYTFVKNSDGNFGLKSITVG